MIFCRFRGGGNFDNVNARACLVSGPPGIGKSTATRIIVEASGYHPIEFNASDSRSKLFIDSLRFGVAKNQIFIKGKLAKACLIMEEVHRFCLSLSYLIATPPI